MSAGAPELTAERLRAVFDASVPLTVGLEEELMLLDPATLDLAPRASDVLALVDGDLRFKRELPASQLEVVTPPAVTVPAAVEVLEGARRALAGAVRGTVRPAGAGVHPFAAPVGVLSQGQRYAWIAEEYGEVAQRQLVCSLQVHVAVGGADLTLAVYNALRSYLPDLAVLAANAPFHAGRDTGFASIRPKIAEALPRQGLPPAIDSWEAFADTLAWGARSGRVPEPRQWWWELRPHPVYGTLEIRACDTQATVADAAAVAAVAHCLVAHLAGRFGEGVPLPVAPTWRIEENRWSANRHGLDGEMADLVTGEREPTRRRLRRLLEELEPVAEQLGCAQELADAARLVEHNGADRQRAVAGSPPDLRRVTAWLAEAFVA